MPREVPFSRMCVILLIESRGSITFSLSSVLQTELNSDVSPSCLTVVLGEGHIYPVPAPTGYLTKYDRFSR